MGLLDFLKKESKSEPPVSKSDGKYYQQDSYYTKKAFNGTQFEKDVITFQERKKTCIPTKRGLYVAEILLLEYCTYGKYPNPKNGYPGFWWFEYGMRNIGSYLQSLEKRGFIFFDSTTSKYNLTKLGEQELLENEYVPYMHKNKLKTTDDARLGPVFNVWSVNKALGTGDKRGWKKIVTKMEQNLISHRDKTNKNSREALRKIDPKLAAVLDKQDIEIAKKKRK